MAKASGAPGGIRTHDPRIRNPVLYPAELRARPAFLYHRRTVTARRRDALVLAGLLLLGGVGGLHAAEPVRLAELRRADEWRLTDGHLIRLASIVVPVAPETVEPAARTLLAAWADKRPLQLSAVPATDRFGREVAVLRDERGEDPRLALLRAGLAVVRAGDEADEQLAPLLAAEQAGRDAGRGVWGELDQMLATPETVHRRIGRFAVVEGVPVAVNERRDATYLDFGEDWRMAFAVRIRTGDLPRFIQAGLHPPSLVGHKLRVRGWPFAASGPMLELRDPLELQPVP
jgi:micrococcal nuclease